MDWILQRYSPQNNSSQGLLLEKTAGNPIFFSHIVEDDDKGEKGDKRFDAGVYELKIQEALTPLTEQHIKDYNKPGDVWFERHIEVTGIAGHSGVYFHSGNNESHTKMCLLPNDTINNNGIDTAINEGSRSTQATKRFYQKVYPFLKAGGRAFLEVRDEDKLK